jgi:hypothetical protein
MRDAENFHRIYSLRFGQLLHLSPTSLSTIHFASVPHGLRGSGLPPPIHSGSWTLLHPIRTSLFYLALHFRGRWSARLGISTAYLFQDLNTPSPLPNLTVLPPSLLPRKPGTWRLVQTFKTSYSPVHFSSLLPVSSTSNRVQSL